MSGEFNHSLDISNWLANIKTDDIDGGLAADFDGSLSGLGMELNSSTYNMSEALMALPVFKQEAIKEGTFQHVLVAATSPATKLYEETLTYLNQGQSYELKLKKTVENATVRSHPVRSIVRVVFHDRRLQYAEREQLKAWSQSHPGERILDTEVPLSYGVSDIKVSTDDLSQIEFMWDLSKDAGVYLKVNCISTEFTAKKHGGEKGVPFRLQVETYAVEGKMSKLVHASSCQIKVFKPKGADRKLKTDRTWKERRSETEKLFYRRSYCLTLLSEAKFQPSYECTVLIEVPLEQVEAYLNHKTTQQTDAGGGTLTPNHSPSPAQNKSDDWSISVSTPNRNTRPETEREEPENHHGNKNIAKRCEKREDSVESSTVTEEHQPLSSTATAHEVTQWLHKNRFSNYVRTFQNFSGSDLFRLSREDLIQICGLADGIRLNNAIHYRTVRPRLTIYVYQGLKADWTGGMFSTLVKLDSLTAHTRTSSREDRSPTNTITDNVSLLSLIQGDLAPGSKVSPSPSPTSSGSPCSTTDLSSSCEQPEKSSISPNLSYTDLPALTKDTMKLSMATSTSTASATATKSLTVPACSTGERKTKRQYGDYDNDSPEEMLYTKKQRTRTLELYPKCVYHAVYLDVLTLQHFKEKLGSLFSIPSDQISRVCVQGPSGIPVLVNNSVVQNLVDDSRFSIEGIREEECTEAKYILMLKSDTNQSTSSIRHS